MSTVNKYAINGLIDTSKNVLDNMQLLATSCGSFVTWDGSAGQWSAVVNETGTSVKSFNDSNILGNINVSGTGVTDLYNSVQVEFPHKDIRGATDFVILSIDTADRFDGELDNQLNIQLPTINDPVQAQLIGNQELKQSRVDKIIQFRTDFSANGIKAGDLIDVTASAYGYTSKLFRVIQLEEEDSDDGALIYSITALEYDEDVYDTTGLTYETRTVRNGIIAKINNEQAQDLDASATTADLARLFIPTIASQLLKNILTRDPETGELQIEAVPVDEDIDKILGGAKKPTLTLSGPEFVCDDGSTVTISVSHTCTSCLFDIPDLDYEYEITGIEDDDLEEDLTGTITVSGGSGSLTLTTTANSDAQQTMTVTIGGVSKNIIIYPIPDESFEVTANLSSITEGQSVTFTVTTQNVADGTDIPYTLSGSASDLVTSPSLTGNITINSNSGTLVVATQDDGEYTGDQSLTLTIAPTGITATPCGTFDFAETVTVEDNDPEPPADNTCEYVLVPIVWCAIYDGSDDEMKGVSVRKSAYLPVAQAGEATVSVPTAISVTKGDPATISIDTTVDVASSSSLGGSPFNVITSFNGVNALGLITGTTTTVYGYDL